MRELAEQRIVSELRFVQLGHEQGAGHHSTLEGAWSGRKGMGPARTSIDARVRLAEYRIGKRLELAMGCLSVSGE